MDEWTRRLIRRTVSRYVGRGIDRADLEQLATLAVLEAECPKGVGWLTHVYRVASHAAWNAVRRERRRRIDSLPMREEEAPASLTYRDVIPLEETFRLLASLPDNEARSIELACALGGGDFRSLSDVAWMMGRQTKSVCRWYRSGLDRIRAANAN